jgi:hypothetical protein
VSYLKVLSRHCSGGGTEDDNEYRSQDSRCPDRGSNSALPNASKNVTVH